MTFAKKISVALTIAGSDSGGGAGIQADLRTFERFGVHGTSAITCVTAQNPKKVSGIYPLKPSEVVAQVKAVFAEHPPSAIKTGMLFSAGIIRAVAELLGKSRAPLIVDPVAVASSGAILLKRDALSAMLERLFPLATLVTPNLDEVALIVGHRPRNAEEMRKAARMIHERFGCAVLVKGGHLRKTATALDILHDDRGSAEFKAPLRKAATAHGTGCTLSAAITAMLANGADLREAIRGAKRHVSLSIANARRAGKSSVIGRWTD